MAVEALGVRDFHAAEDEFASCDELMNIVSDADVNHALRLGDAAQGRKVLLFTVGRNNLGTICVQKGMERFLRLLAIWVCVAGGSIVVQARETIVPVWRANVAANEVSVTSDEWIDSHRDRQVPVKIYAPAAGSGPFPVIVFSHGLGGTRDGYEYLGQCWAAHGYVSVHLQHAGSDDAVWKDAGTGGRMSAMHRAAAQPRNAMDRVQDVTFALDQLVRLNQTNSAWRGKLELGRVGVAGHSFGAHTTLAVAGAAYSGWGGTTQADLRVKAAIPMSAPAPANKSRLDEAFAGVKIPCFHMTGTQDDSPIGETKAVDRRVPFDHCQNSDQFLLTFTGGDHGVFGGRVRKLGGEKDAEFQQLICLGSLAFWDAYLRGEVDAKVWLTRDFPGALKQAGSLEVKAKH